MQLANPFGQCESKQETRLPGEVFIQGHKADKWDYGEPVKGPNLS